jgi:hypothetical protein
MKKQIETLETLSEIRSLMEQSSRFISLNGLAGVFAGSFALIGAIIAYIFINQYNILYFNTLNQHDFPFLYFFIIDASAVLILSVSAATLLSIRKARKKGLRVWDKTTKRLLINFLTPLLSGGIFCLILLFHGIGGLIAPATLIFYGLALINASKYTLNDIRYLGYIELIIGLISSFIIGYGLFFWALGFGIAHIVYGIVMYFKYEK